MPGLARDHLDQYTRYLGVSLLRFQLFLLAIACGVSAVLWLLQGHSSILTVLIYTLISGNIVTVLTFAAAPLFTQPFPRDWIVYTALLLPIAFLASTVAALVAAASLGIPAAHRVAWLRANVPFGALISIISGLSIYAFSSTRERMLEANSLLAQEVHHGRQELASHASELRAAFEIQSNLLPRTIPQIPGVDIACSWQPARTVSGDFFDVLVLSETRIGFCLADVSGKGMSAALLTANLQATFRAFAADEPSPAHLCRRLNQALCASLPPGRFVTFVYGILDRRRLTLTYELAGHTPPTLLRGAETLSLPGNGPVLGLLPDAAFADTTVRLQPGDRLILSTDGVAEAFNSAEEEFGEDRLIAAARQPGLTTAHLTRASIMREVTRFAEGNFHDDASLMIVQLA